MEPVSLEPIIKGRRLGFECSLSDTTKFIAVIHEDFTGSQNRTLVSKWKFVSFSVPCSKSVKQGSSYLS